MFPLGGIPRWLRLKQESSSLTLKRKRKTKNNCVCFVSVFLVRADNAWSPSTPPESVSCHVDLCLEKTENRWRTGKRSDAAQRTGTPTSHKGFSARRPPGRSWLTETTMIRIHSASLRPCAPQHVKNVGVSDTEVYIRTVSAERLY